MANYTLAKTHEDKPKKTLAEQFPVPAEQQATAESHGTLMKVSVTTYVSALTTAAMSMKYAVGLEVATALSIYAEYGGASRDAKKYLMSIYEKAGYATGSIDAAEYKTVSRRILASSLLWANLGQERVLEMIGGGAEGMAINNIARELESLNIKSVDAVFAYVGKPRNLPKPATKRAVSSNDVYVEDVEEKPKLSPTEALKALYRGTQPAAPEMNTLAEGELEEGEIIIPEQNVGGGSTGLFDDIHDKFDEYGDPIVEKEHNRNAMLDEYPNERPSANTKEFIEGKGDFLDVSTMKVKIHLLKGADRDEVLQAALELMEIADEMEVRMPDSTEVNTTLATKLLEEMKKMSTGKKAAAELEGGLEAMKQLKPKRATRAARVR